MNSIIYSVKDTCILSTEVERFIFQILVELQQYRFNTYLNIHRKNTGLAKIPICVRKPDCIPIGRQAALSNSLNIPDYFISINCKLIGISFVFFQNSKFFRYEKN